MARISIAYTVPVQVIVDTELGTVGRVVVIDEEARPDPAGFTEDASTYRPAEQADVDRAYAIAGEPEAEWPSWDIGW